ncbi:MAG TPA: threonylcarbamoyl-AMP synthase [Methanothermococcus okinawensis]|uniref:L-threonylcarbamoyladenylate synthase n=1 Tax=Methanothermococcus okinawensis TaxID=155863 RepID=A0A832YSY1_9EURY|nr:threonylcarbamoyl-AMP synthase [Methanothermococcus okinawensis]
MAHILKIKSTEELNKHIEFIKKIILEGNVFICGTDTLYALCVNALDESALKKIYKIKKRDRNKPVSIFLRDIRDIEKYAYVDSTSRKIIDKFLPGPLTMVLIKKDSIPDILSKDYIGIRVPNSQIIRKLSMVPLTATSANLSGKTPPSSFDEIDRELIDKVDLIIDTGVCPYKKPSTVIKVIDNKVELIREGVVDFKKIEKVIKENDS